MCRADGLAVRSSKTDDASSAIKNGSTSAHLWNGGVDGSENGTSSAYTRFVERPLAFIAFFGFDPRRTRFRTLFPRPPAHVPVNLCGNPPLAGAHRIGGAAFIITYAVAWLLYTVDYDRFVRTRCAIPPAAIGVFQAVSAAMTFRFLPNHENSGYFSDKGILSRAFVKENIFYQLQTAFGAIWYTYGNEALERTLIGKLAMIVFVFLPFTVLRPLFPITRFSTTQKTKARYRSEGMSRFYFTGTELIRYFYLYGKHCMGFGFNYLFFLGVVSPDDMRKWGTPLFLLNTGTVSIAIFLHTLRFKKLMRPRHSFLTYLAMAYASFLAVPPLCMKLYSEPLVMYLVFQGIIINLACRFGLRKLMHVHYIAAMLVLLRYRAQRGNPFV